MKSHESAVNGNTNFIKAIVRELGPIATIKLLSKTNRMYKEYDRKGLTLNQIKDMQELQSLILKTSFDKRFQNIKDINDAQECLERLRNFEKYRCKITYLKENGDIEQDISFKEYYTNRYNECIRLFKNESSLLRNYRYRENNITIDNRNMEDNIFIENRARLQSDVKFRLQQTLIEKCEGDISHIPKNLRVSILRNGDTWFINKINNSKTREEDIPRMLKIGYSHWLEKESIKIRNPNMDEIQFCKQFLREMNFEREPIDISYTEEELEMSLRLYQRQKQMQEQQEENKLKKVTIVDKIRSKLYNIFGKRKKNVLKTTEYKNVLNDINSSDKKLPSWDLRNWSEEEIANSGMSVGNERRTTNKDLYERNADISQHDEYDK